MFGNKRGEEGKVVVCSSDKQEGMGTGMAIRNGVNSRAK
jgi:hypothetical protein